MKWFLLVLGGLVFGQLHSQTVAFRTTDDLLAMMSAKPSVADSILSSKGFANVDVDGLKFVYVFGTEKVLFQSTPRQFTYEMTSSEAYFKLSNEASEKFQLLSDRDSILTNGSYAKAVSFKAPGATITFATTGSKTKNNAKYIISLNIADGSSSAKIETPQETKSGVTGLYESMYTRALTQKNTTEQVISKDGLACKKSRFTMGMGFYRFPQYIKVNGVLQTPEYEEGLIALNLGFEISKSPEMKFKNGFYTNTRLDLNWTSFTDMQAYYITEDASGYVTNMESIYLTKHYMTFGMISEVRWRKESFLMCFAPGLNWNRGNYEDGLDYANSFAGVVQMGEYLQHNFKSKRTNMDSTFLRFGFEQFFSVGSGYIGQFAITLGI